MLRGENIDELGVRFPDMSRVYYEQIIKTALVAADKLNIPMREGVYVQTQGPNYETPEEIRAFATLGADAVGMSTACEAIAARHMGMKVCGISCISNMAAGISEQELSHEEVKATADRVSKDFKRLLRELIINENG